MIRGEKSLASDGYTQRGSREEETSQKTGQQNNNANRHPTRLVISHLEVGGAVHL
jgi:hypothetical protein